MKKILVLEDEENIRSFVVINLKRAGYEVVEAGTGEEALELLKANPDVGVAILDIMLPGIDGFEVCRRVRAAYPHIGIIMLTARSQEMDKVTGLMTGADDYVTKPFSPAELTARVDALLRRAGVDTADVQRLFQGTLSDMIERYDIIRHAELYHNDIAIAAVEQDIDRVTAAKAADELLTLRGVRASFVLFKHDTGVNLSARSLGEINVQLIMEKLGGGGNSTTAGGQIPDGTVDAVREQLIAAIDQYLEG